MKYQEIKAAAEAKTNQLIIDCKVFFAFSDKQFDENKTPLHEGEKYVRMFGGGFIPKFQVEKFNQGMEDISAWRKAEIKKYKQQDEQIKYELYNHECFYTGDPQPVVDLLPDVPKERILAVYRQERPRANANL